MKYFQPYCPLIIVLIMAGCSKNKSSASETDSCEDLPAVTEIFTEEDTVKIAASIIADDAVASIDSLSSITPDIKYALPGRTPYHFFKEHSLPESRYRVQFEMNFVKSPKDPFWLRKFLNHLIQRKLKCDFNFSYGKDISPKLFDIHPSSTWNEVGNHYFNWMKRHYIKAYPLNKKDDKYEADEYYFKITAYPVWEDDKYITYQFYIDRCFGTMHNNETDFCRTYEKSTGRLLGITDFYTKEEFENTLTELTKQLENKLGREVSGPDVKYEDFLIEASSDMDLKEKYDNKLYPRPARLKDGIIFSYQTFELGAPRSFGTMKFVIPYDKPHKRNKG